MDHASGEEADIIILSLVRNPGEGRGGIGFLKVRFSDYSYHCVSDPHASVVIK